MYAKKDAIKIVGIQILQWRSFFPLLSYDIYLF